MVSDGGTRSELESARDLLEEQNSTLFQWMHSSWKEMSDVAEKIRRE